MPSDRFCLPTACLDKQITNFLQKASFPYFCSSEYDCVLRCAYNNIYVGFVFKRMSDFGFGAIKKKSFRKCGIKPIWRSEGRTDFAEGCKLWSYCFFQKLLLGDQRQITWGMCQSENSDDCTLIENEGFQLSLTTEAVKCSVLLICWRWMGG